MTTSPLKSSQYSGQQCCSLDGLNSSSYFSLLVLLPILWWLCQEHQLQLNNNNNNIRHFHVPQFFQFPSKGPGTYLPFHFLSILLCSQPGQQSPQFCKFSFLLLLITKSGHLAEIRWSVCISKFQRSLCVSFSRTDTGLDIYHSFVCSNLNFLHNSQWITLPTQSCPILYYFCANSLHSLMWLIVCLYHYITYICCFVASYIYSCFDMIGPYGVVLCCYEERFSFSLYHYYYYYC